jgi:serine/threonine-protein kinase
MPGTIIANHYLIGKLLDFNGESATYIAYDTEITCPVFIREFMPFSLCKRVPKSPTISVNPADVAAYKTYMADFTELHKSLARMRDNSCLYKIIGLFAENNSTYVVYDYVETVSLVSFLKENSGELSWELVSKMFPPLFTALNFIHNANIYHRGISPETLRITTNAEIKLNDFAISAERTVGTDITPEIFQGYAAPEQYSLNSRQGAHTDVYGICAVLYRTLTGTMPTDAKLRMEKDDLPPLHEINNNIPISVSKAIMNGLTLNASERIQSLSELVTALFSTNSSPVTSRTMEIIKQKTDIMQQPTAIIKTQAKPEQEPQYKPIVNQPKQPVRQQPTVIQPQPSSFDKIKVPIIITLLIAAIVLILVFLIKMFIGGNDSASDDLSDISSATTTKSTIVSQTEITTAATTTTTMIKMYNIVGNEVSKYTDFFNFFEPNIIEEYNDEKNPDGTPKYPVGIIYESSVPVNQMFEMGSKVDIYVSKGLSYVELPVVNYANNSTLINDYLAQLELLGINTKDGIPDKPNMVKIEYRYDYYYIDDEVLEVDRTVFSFKDFYAAETDEQKEAAKLKIIVSKYGDENGDTGPNWGLR